MNIAIAILALLLVAPVAAQGQQETGPDTEQQEQQALEAQADDRSSQMYTIWLKGRENPIEFEGKVHAYNEKNPLPGLGKTMVLHGDAGWLRLRTNDIQAFLAR